MMTKNTKHSDYTLIEANVRALCAGDRTKRGVLLEAFTPLIVSLAKRYGGNDPEEAFQEGCVDFLKALDHLNPEKAATFPAFIKRRLESRFINRAKRLQLPCISLETCNKETGKTLGESLADPKPTDVIARHDLHQALKVLKSVRCPILFLQYGKGLSISAIAKRLGKSRATIFRHREKELAYLRQVLGMVDGKEIL